MMREEGDKHNGRTVNGLRLRNADATPPNQWSPDADATAQRAADRPEESFTPAASSGVGVWHSRQKAEEALVQRQQLFLGSLVVLGLDAEKIIYRQWHQMALSP